MRRKEVISLLLAANILSVSAMQPVRAEEVHPEQIEAVVDESAGSGESTAATQLPADQTEAAPELPEIEPLETEPLEIEPPETEPPETELPEIEIEAVSQPREQAGEAEQLATAAASAVNNIAEPLEPQPEAASEAENEAAPAPDSGSEMPTEEPLLDAFTGGAVEPPPTVPEPLKQEPPQISVENVRIGSANSLPVAPTIRISGSQLDEDRIEIQIVDENNQAVPAAKELTKNDEGLLFALSEIKNDGIYTLSVKGYDQSGNQAETKYVFSVNRSGTRFTYDQTKAAQRMSKFFTPEISMENIDEITVLSCMNNGKEVPYRLEHKTLSVAPEALSAGKNKITLEVRDSAGNISVMKPWEFNLEVSSAAQNKLF